MVHANTEVVTVCRWMDGMAMLRVLDVLNAHSTLLLQHHPLLLPPHAPLFLKAAAWNPHLLHRHALRTFPLFLAQPTLPQLLAYVLDVPTMAAAQDTVLTKDVHAASAYAWLQARGQVGLQAVSGRRSMGAIVDDIAPAVDCGSHKHTLPVHHSGIRVGHVFLVLFGSWDRRPWPPAGGRPLQKRAREWARCPSTRRAVQHHGSRLSRERDA